MKVPSCSKEHSLLLELGIRASKLSMSGANQDDETAKVALLADIQKIEFSSG